MRERLVLHSSWEEGEKVVLCEERGVRGEGGKREEETFLDGDAW